jgi:hypothetical protein
MLRCWMRQHRLLFAEQQQALGPAAVAVAVAGLPLEAAAATASVAQAAKAAHDLLQLSHTVQSWSLYG